MFGVTLEGVIMEALAIYKDFTPQKIGVVASILGRGKHRLSREQREKLSKVRKAWWRSLTEVEKSKALESSVNSPEALEAKRRIWLALGYEGRVERCKGSFNSSEALEKKKGNFEIMSQEEKSRKVSHLSSSGVRERAKVGWHRYWDSLTKEQREERLGRGIHSRESRLKAIAASCSKPNNLEREFLSFLEFSFPGTWGFNGDGRGNVVVGGRIPDFVRLDGTKQIISLMGGLGIYHFFGDDYEEVEYYKRFGYRCLVVWEWEVLLVTLRESIRAFMES